MPLADFISPDGEVRELWFQKCIPSEVKGEDGRMWVRSEVHRIAFIGQARPLSQGDEVLRGYRDQEAALGSRFRSVHSVETIKRAWQGDTEPEVPA